MTAVYAVAVFVGVISIILWIALGVVGTPDDEQAAVDPERRFGARGRAIVAGVTGFGMAGISATFAGWNVALALAAAVVGAGAMAYAAARLGPVPNSK